MNENKQITLKDRFLFIIPSLIGVLLFMIPVPSKDGVTIPIAILSKALQDLLGDHIQTIMVGIIIVALLGTIIAKVLKPGFIKNSPFFTALFIFLPFGWWHEY